MPDQLFTHTSGPRDARIIIVGEAWGYEEAKAGRPFVGASGQELTRILADARIDRASCLLTNVVHAQPLANKMWRFFYPRDEARKKGIPDKWGLHPMPLIDYSLKQLYELVDIVKPELIIAAGNYPFWAFSDDVRTAYASSDASGVKMEGGGRVLPGGITSFRGSMIRTRPTPKNPKGYRLLPIIHPAAIMRKWDDRFVTVGDLLNRVPMALADDWENPSPPKLIFRPTLLEAIDYLSDLLFKLNTTKEIIEVSIDLETAWHNIVTCISFCYDPKVALTVPFIDKRDDTFISYWLVAQEKKLHYLIRRIITHPRFRAVGQNFAYDQAHMLAMFGAIPPLGFDTMLAQNLLFPGTPKALGRLSSIYCRYHRFWKDDNQEWDTKSSIDDHLLYNAEDTVRTLEIAGEQRKLLKTLKRDHLYVDYLKVADLTLRMSLKGMCVDKHQRAKLMQDLMAASEVRKRLLLRWIPQSWLETKSPTLWFGSPAQTKTVLYEILQMQEQKHRKTKQPSTDDASIATLKQKYPEFSLLLQLILDMRSIGVYISTFLTSALEPNGRMCTSLDPAGTETFRFASRTNAFRRGMNLQNIPGD